MGGNIIVEISVVPIGTGTTSLSGYVADCVSVLESEKGLSYQLTPMGTIVEGPWEQIFQVVKLMHEIPFKKGALRVVTTIKIDDRRDKKATMQKKIRSVLKINPEIKVVGS